MTEASRHQLIHEPSETNETERLANLFSALYRELHLLADRALKRQGNPLSISATTVLHEVFISLNHREHASFPTESGFLAYAAQAMRGYIVDVTRRRLATKRGGDAVITALHTDLVEELHDEEYLLSIADAQEALWQIDSSLAELVDLKYFCGLSLAEIAALRDVTERTVQREWHRARLLLLNLLDEDAARAAQR